MRTGTRVRTKICCIKSVAEAELAIRCGADALGLVASMPSGPGVISEAAIAEIAATVPPPVATFLLTAHQDTEAIIEQHRRCRTSTIQICDRITRGDYAGLRRSLPGVKLVQVIHVEDEASVVEARQAAGCVDALLLDSGRPAAAVKELGGTGRTHDWDLSRRICATVDAPVFLAGGLNPDNVAGAVAAVRPFGVDVCSGLRCGDALNEAKLRAYFDALRTCVEN